MSNLTDEQLVRESKKGKLKFFEELVRRHQEKVFYYALKRVRDRHVAADVVQETFVSVYQNLERFDANKKFKPWLYRIAQNKCFDHLRSLKVAELSESVADERDRIMETVIQKEAVREVWGALTRLPEKYREVLKHYYFEELSYEQLARRWKLPINTIRTRLRRGKENLFKIINDARKGKPD